MKRDSIIRSIYLLLTLTTAINLNNANASIKLPALVGNNMVLQRGKPIRLWGAASPAEKVTVLFKGKKYEAIASMAGQWNIMLPAQKAGGPYNMTIAGKDTVNLSNILFGDVWLCSGQSNMYFTTREANDAENEIAAANFPSIRLFYVPTKLATARKDDVQGTWAVCNPASIRSFSAVAYFFAKNLQPDINVPIGLIESAFGGTPIEAWISADGMKNEPQFNNRAASLALMDQDETNHQMLNNFNKWIDTIEKLDPGYTNGTYAWSKYSHPDWKTMELPGYFENRDKLLKGRDGIVWFSKNIQLTERDLTDNCIFNMGPVIDDDIVFINGIKIGGTREAKYSPRTYHVPLSALHAGSNTITIRVIDYGDFAGINGKAEQFYLKTANQNITLAGSWNYKNSLDTVFKTIHDSKLNQEHEPCVLYNAMIAPLTAIQLTGVIWYQGESNINRAYQYRSLLKRLINDWRYQFNMPHLPFLIVQLANNNATLPEPRNSYWAELREAQALALSLPNTGMVTAIDIGDGTNIHFKNKQDVGLRLALLAREMVYGEHQLFATGPEFVKAVYNGNNCSIEFKNVGYGLKVKDGTEALTGFQVATAGSETFVFTKAVIIKKSLIEIESPDGKPITAVRYAWADNPGVLNLVNSAGFPAFPFRTDHFKEISYDVRYN